MRCLKEAACPVVFAKTLVGSLLIGSLHLHVHAQNLPEVVISVTRAEQRSFDAPAAIDSVDRETIQNAGAQVNLSESLNRVPGLTILNRQNYAQDLQVSIRGFGARSAFGIRGIRLLIDGIPATTPDGQGQGSSVSLTSTDRIEVLRGPLAQLYGNSAGGVIQAFTRDAPLRPEADVQYFAGSYGMHRTDWQLGSRFGANGQVGLVVDYSTFDTNGYRDNSRTERKQFNGKLSFGPDDKTRVNLVFNQFDMPLALDPVGLTAAQLAANPQQAGTNAEARRVRKTVLQNQAGATLTHALDADRYITARMYTGTRDNLQFQAGNTWVGLARNYYGLGLQYNAQTSMGATPVRWVAGYEFDRSREYRTGGAAALGEKVNTTRQEDNQAENSDLFFQATAFLSERWSMVGGARYSTVRFTSDDFFVTPANGDGSGNVSYSAFSPVLGATYHARDNLNLFVNYGRGFETPTLAEAAYSSTSLATARFNTTLNAALSQHYEAGLKWMPTPRNRLDATIFQVNTTDEIVVLGNTAGITSFKNAPGTSRTGLELSSQNKVASHWAANAAVSWIDAIYSQSFTNGTTAVANGNKLPGIPQHTLFTELVWTSQNTMQTLSPARKKQVGSQAALELVSAGRLFANDTNTASADGYTTLNLRASQAWPVGSGRLTAFGRIDNLTDQRFVGSVIVNQASFQFYEPAPGINWTLGLRLSVPW